MDSSFSTIPSEVQAVKEYAEEIKKLQKCFERQQESHQAVQEEVQREAAQLRQRESYDRLRRQLEDHDTALDNLSPRLAPLGHSSPQKQDEDNISDIIRKYRLHVSELQDQAELNQQDIEGH